MANKDLEREPHNVTDDFWWYEEPAGIVIIMQPAADMAKGAPVIGTIKWRSLRAALQRKDKGQ